MSLFVSSITNRGAMPALEKSLAYNEARLQVIAENIANYGTPHYRTKRLDQQGFQQALGEALARKGADAHTPLVVEQDDQAYTDQQGYLQVTPVEEPAENVLFHDGTNMSLEHQMAELARTGMSHDLYTSLLQGRFEGLRKAIRGQP